jgi:hypothetical protein
LKPILWRLDDQEQNARENDLVTRKQKAAGMLDDGGFHAAYGAADPVDFWAKKIRLTEVRTAFLVELLFQPAFPVVADEFVDEVTHQPDHQPLQNIRLALHT